MEVTVNGVIGKPVMVTVLLVQSQEELGHVIHHLQVLVDPTVILLLTYKKQP